MKRRGVYTTYSKGLGGVYNPYDHGEWIEDEQEVIEGCALEDVGWMKGPFDGVMDGYSLVLFAWRVLSA